jgi:hypothetical protein
MGLGKVFSIMVFLKIPAVGGGLYNHPLRKAIQGDPVGYQAYPEISILTARLMVFTSLYYAGRYERT